MSVFQSAPVNVVDFEDQKGELTVPAGGGNRNSVLKFTCRNGLRCFITFVGEAWDAALDFSPTYAGLTKYIEVNGNMPFQFKRSQVQIAPPEQPYQELSPWLEVPMGSTIEWLCDVPAGAVAGQVSARIKVAYAMLDYIK